jgi:hypothetical protein
VSFCLPAPRRVCLEIGDSWTQFESPCLQKIALRHDRAHVIFVSILLIPPIGNNDTNDDRLQHTDVDVPHFTDGDHNFVKGAFHTIDRPYDKLDPWGAIDFLHHKIGSTHVAHHFDSTIPHYKAQVATDAIKEAFPEIYLYDPTPIPEALWRVCKGCAAVEKRGEYYIWDNSDVKDELLKTE